MTSDQPVAVAVQPPPHLAHEWEALTRSEQRDVLRWAGQVIRQDAQRILREPRPWINTSLCRRMPEVDGDDWCVAHGMRYPHDA